MRRRYFDARGARSHALSLILLACSLLFALATKLIVEYLAFASISLDGRFQTFNIVRDLRAGCSPFVDCVPYLGLNISYLLTALSFVFGDTPFGVSVTSQVVAWSLAAGSVILTLRLSGLSWRSTSLATAALLLVLRWVAPVALEPGNSLRSVRAAAPAAAAALLWLTCHRRSALDAISPGCVEAAGFGAVGGFFFLWSNDFGIATSVATIGAWIVCVENWRRPWLAICRCLVCVITAGAVILAILSLSSSVGDWHRVSGQIAANQFWYFAPFGAHTRLTDLSDLRALTGQAMVVIGGLLIAAVSILARRFWLGDRSFAVAMLALILAGTFGGGMIYNVFGQIDASVWQAAMRALLPVLVGETLFWASRKAAASPPRLTGSKNDFLRAAARNSLIATALLVLVTAALDARVALASWRIYQHNRDLVGRPAMNAARSVLGAYPDSDIVAAACFKRLGERFDRAGLSRNRRIWSQYTSVLDLAAGSRQPTSAPTWIFLFSAQARRAVIDAVRARPPALVLTIANDYQPWANWLSRANWPLYREILTRYEPVLRTRQHIIWVRRDRPWDEQPAQPCGSTQLSPNRVRLRVASSSRTTASAPEWMEIDQALRPSLIHGGLPAVGDRLQLNVRVPSDDPLGRVNAAPGAPEQLYLYGIDPDEHRALVPIVRLPGRASYVDVEASPEGRGRVTADGQCTATAIAPFTLTLDHAPPPLQDCAQLDAAAVESMRRLGLVRQ